MTIAQIITVAIAGPLAIICLAKLFLTLFHKTAEDFELIHAIILVACGLAIFISFYGIK